MPKVNYIYQPFNFQQGDLEVLCDDRGRITMKQTDSAGEYDEIQMSAKTLVQLKSMLKWRTEVDSTSNRT